MMYKVSEAKRSCIREGNHEPTQKQIADQAGMTVEKLQKLRSIQKITLSLQKPVWANDSTTYEVITNSSPIFNFLLIENGTGPETVTEKPKKVWSPRVQFLGTFRPESSIWS